MKNKKETTRKNTLIKTDKSLDKYTKMNLFEDKFNESKALLMKTQFSFR